MNYSILARELSTSLSYHSLEDIQDFFYHRLPQNIDSAQVINWRDSQECALVKAATLGLVPHLRLLLQEGADINTDGYVPILLSHTSDCQIIQLLLDQCSLDINATTPISHHSALMLSKTVSTTRLLLTQPGLSVNAQNAEGNTALMVFCAMRDPSYNSAAIDEIINLLLCHPGVSALMMNKKGLDALKMSQRHSNKRKCYMLLGHLARQCELNVN
eukprot:scaffold2187_cov182-Ochromonas_danica.AAC.6